MSETTKPPMELELLCRAVAIIEDEGRWTTGVFARSQTGKSLCLGRGIPATDKPEIRWVDTLSNVPLAPTCWCALGAMQEVARELEGYFTHLTNLRHRVNERFAKEYGTDIDVVNDEHGHEEILSCLLGLATMYAEEGQDA